MLLEEANLRYNRVDLPDGLSWTILLSNLTSNTLVEKIRGAWLIIATLGRQPDSHLGDWPSAIELESSLPKWLSRQAFIDQGYGFDTWRDDLLDREWFWWSSRREQNGTYRILLQAEAMPISVWTLQAVIELAGATILASDIEIANELLD